MVLVLKTDVREGTSIAFLPTHHVFQDSVFDRKNKQTTEIDICSSCKWVWRSCSNRKILSVNTLLLLCFDDIIERIYTVTCCFYKLLDTLFKTSDHKRADLLSPKFKITRQFGKNLPLSLEAKHVTFASLFYRFFVQTKLIRHICLWFGRRWSLRRKFETFKRFAWSLRH